MKENSTGAKKQLCPYANSFTEQHGFLHPFPLFHSSRPPAKRRRYCAIPSNGIGEDKVTILNAPTPATPVLTQHLRYSQGQPSALNSWNKTGSGESLLQVSLKMLVEQESGRGTAAGSRIYFTCLTPCKIKATIFPPTSQIHCRLSENLAAHQPTGKGNG